MGIELGSTKTEFDDNLFDDVSGVTGEIDLQVGVGSPFQWGVTASREIGDRLQSEDRGITDITTDDELFESGLAEVFVAERFAVNFLVRSGSNAYSLEVEAREDDYETVGRDREALRSNFSFTRRIREGVALASSLIYSEEDFTSTGQEDEIFIGEVGVDWSFSRRLELG